MNKPRDIEQLVGLAMSTFDLAYYRGAFTMAPLFSGGHDSLVACHLASQHKAFGGVVHHIDTGIGAKYTRLFVQRVCDSQGWKLRVHKSKQTYEQFVAQFGFPWVMMHSVVYRQLKERCVQRIVRGKSWKMLVNGARAQESHRRMGYVVPIRHGDITKSGPRKGKRRNLNRMWTAPCHDWSKAEQQLYMDEFGLPTNKIKVAVGISGECFCGAFAHPGELEKIREHAPDVATEIDRLAIIAATCGKPCLWGQRPPECPAPLVIPETGPLCIRCDQRAMIAKSA
jgi:3'-phosphoadenosine 5'-phosphosulfate sulfotransferase (PAPS reductase)/FAD synthetase